MNFIDKLERKYGRFAIRNLTVYILVAYAIGYLTYAINPDMYLLLTMDAEAIFENGQVWRLVTWICTMPQNLSIFIIFMFMFFYWIGSVLESTWGSFKYNLFIFSGMFFMTLGSLVIYFITYFVGPSSAIGGISIPINTYYINLTLFLAFAMIYGEQQVYFMLILPVKVKWLAILDLLLIAYDFFNAGNIVNFYRHIANEGVVAYLSLYVWCYRITIVISILNFIIFYFVFRKSKQLSPKASQTRKKFKKDSAKIRPQTAVHKCEICGKTNLDDDTLVFRYCSKCEGNHEYCQDHLFTHEHIKS